MQQACVLKRPGAAESLAFPVLFSPLSVCLFVCVFNIFTLVVSPAAVASEVEAPADLKPVSASLMVIHTCPCIKIRILDFQMVFMLINGERYADKGKLKYAEVA